MKTVSKEFGSQFTDHMFVMEWQHDKQWHNKRIQKYQSFVFDPACVHMHYGQEIFEGIKAFYSKNGLIQLFRPHNHLQRMNQSARIMCMPEIDIKEVYWWLKNLIQKDAQWVPTDFDSSLYIRPAMIATEKTINLRPANTYTFFIILSPVSAIYTEGMKPISVFVTKEHTRTSIGGVGEAKTGGNYAASMRVQKIAQAAQCTQVLWLDPVKHTYVEEVGSMNIFFVFDDTIVTPSLSGTILPGITRSSILALGKKLGMNMIERKISIDEVISGINSGKLKEIFGTGTAVGILPIGTLNMGNHIYTINNNIVGAITRRFSSQLTHIQHGTGNIWMKQIS